jgi:hypothetical protein
VRSGRIPRDPLLWAPPTRDRCHTPNMQRSCGDTAEDIAGVRLHRGHGHSLDIHRDERDLRRLAMACAITPLVLP